MTYRDTAEALAEVRETALVNGESVSELQRRRNDYARRFMPASYAVTTHEEG